MKGAERRMMIFQTLKTAGKPISGSSFAKQFGVSRQVIVQDIALLRAEGNDIVSTSSGYLLSEQFQASRVFKVHHDDASIEQELTMMVDLGGKVKDVFVSHKVYSTDCCGSTSISTPGRTSRSTSSRSPQGTPLRS